MSEMGRSDVSTVTPERRWGVGGVPLPVRRLTVRGCRASTPPLDFSGYMRKLCDDVKLRCPTFAHLDPSAMAFTYTTSRTPGKYGLLARVTPLRFRDGGVFHRHRGNLYQSQRYFLDGRELLYLVTFCLPRFLNLPFEEKLVTVIHELFHISPRFDGDVRRHDGRYQYHSHSKRGYDDLMGKMTRAYLADHPEPALFAPFHSTFAELCAAHGGVLAVSLPRPRMVRVGQPVR
jgi:hypothetical protein